MGWGYGWIAGNEVGVQVEGWGGDPSCRNGEGRGTEGLGVAENWEVGEGRGRKLTEEGKTGLWVSELAVEDGKVRAEGGWVGIGKDGSWVGGGASFGRVVVRGGQWCLVVRCWWW